MKGLAPISKAEGIEECQQWRTRYPGRRELVSPGLGYSLAMSNETNADSQPLEDDIIDNLDDEDVILPDKYAITSYGADYPVDGLVRRMADGGIFVPSFQRGFVWSLKRASRFIESLLLGLPVPGVFLSREQRSQKLLVIDGQQRLRTLQFFYEGIFAQSGKEFALRGVQSQFAGLTYRALADEDRRRLDDSIIHATIVKQDEPSEDESSIYHIFERLNTGGELLKPQEIRACIYHGSFSDLLRELNGDQSWRRIFGGVNARMRDQELILRFLALLHAPESYVPPMKEFLNRFMGRNRDLPEASRLDFERGFLEAIALAERCIGEGAFRRERALNAAVFDSVMVGLARRLRCTDVGDPTALREEYQRLLENPSFRAATEKATARPDQVEQRIRLATAAFCDAR